MCHLLWMILHNYINTQGHQAQSENKIRGQIMEEKVMQFANLNITFEERSAPMPTEVALYEKTLEKIKGS